MDSVKLACIIADNMFNNNVVDNIVNVLFCNQSDETLFCLKLREIHHRNPIPDDHWIQWMQEITFFQLFRMKKETFMKLLDVVTDKDKYKLITKKYVGGRYPVPPHKSLLVFLWYLSHQDTLHSIADRFNLVPSTVMKIVNSVLYIIIQLKNNYIFWPKTLEEFQHIQNGFTTYPGVIGAIDGTHINLKVPSNQHASYVDRYMQHSITMIAICTSEKILTYVFIGFPGAAHDSRVFSYSQFFQNIQTAGSTTYFPTSEMHILGDSAFPIKPWLMTPYRHNENYRRLQRRHNYCLSAARVVIENTFGIIKGRYRRLHFINTYSVAKAIEIVTAACVVHNFCYFHNDEWDGEVLIEDDNDENLEVPQGNERELGRAKRDRIARDLFNNDN